MPGLNFSSQNVRSLNISTKNSVMDQKLYSITKNKDDIIFLCDLRLNSPHQVAGMNDLNKKFGFYGYKLYHHSRKSSRGVGILISKKVDHQVHGTKTDAGDNFILLDVVIRGVRFTQMRSK